MATRRLDEAETWLAGRAAGYAAAHARQLRAELALVRTEIDAGVREAQAALDAFDALPAPADTAAAALDFARLAWQGGLGARVPLTRWLERAATGFEQVGDRSSRERALALAVDVYRRLGSERPIVRDRDLLNAVRRLLDSLPDFGQLTREAMRMAVEQLDAERGVLLLAADDGGDLRPEVEHGAIDAATRNQAVTFSRDVVRRVAKSGGSVVIDDAATDPDRLSNSMVELGLRSVMCVPMFAGETLVGAVYVDDSRRPEVFGDHELHLLEGFAGLLGAAIHNSREQARVREANERLAGENLTLRREAGRSRQRAMLVGGSRAMRDVLELIERAASTRATVLITGEPGTGKELVARMIHRAGPRSAQPFVAVNCGAIGKGVLESELFGHRKGSFTDAKESRAGHFESAHRGTLFLDEIGEMPLDQQVALLRVLTEGAVTPVGGGRPIPVDVRIIAASNRDLSRRRAEGEFREDLWYRLNVFPIELPPLRDRRADVPALAQHFVEQFAEQMGRELPVLSPALMEMLMRSNWPGNVRELENYIARLLAMTRGNVLQPNPLPDDLEKSVRDGRRAEESGSLRRMVAALERREVLQALDRNQGNQVRAARDLGITEQSLRYRLRKYGGHGSRRNQRTR
jgi:transcriptional regulator with GAF, ATPase, and Fis domain